MRLTLFLLIAGFMQLSASVYSQTTRLNVDLKNASFEEILDNIKEQSEFNFLYRSDIFKGLEKIDLKFADVTLENILDKVLVPEGFDYVIEDNVVVIRKRTEQTPQDSTMSVMGQVLDANGHPLPGTTIRIKGTNIGVASDKDGNYTIRGKVVGEPILVFSFIGFKTQEIPVNGNPIINVTMEADQQDVSEVVVTGIFQKSKASYTGAVTTVSAAELEEMGTRNIISKINYIDPGFVIVENNELGSDPNSLPEINIRGNSNMPNVNELQDNTRALLNAPLVVLDGFESSLQRLYDLNEFEVESITILKDASATAIYGARGANGVIVVTTKSPTMGKLRVTYSADVNIETPDLTSYNLLDAWRKLELERRAGYWDGNPPYYNELLNNVNAGVNTDWLSQAVRTGIGQTHGIKIDGGDKTFRYSASVRYKNTIGVMKESSRDVINGSITLSYYYKNLRFSNNLRIDGQTQSESPYGSFSSYAAMNPYYRMRDDAGNLIIDYRNAMGGYNRIVSNPLYNAELNTYDKSDYTSFANNFMLEWKLKPTLVLTGKIGISRRLSESDAFKPAEHTDFLGDEYEGTNVFKKGSYDYGTGRNTSFEASANLRYTKTWKDKHTLYSAVDYNIRESKGYNYLFSAEGFTNEDFDFLPLALGYLSDSKPTGGESHTRAIGIVGNVNYTYDKRYFADLSLRTDGASQYGTKKRFAPFWSAGVGWNMHDEAFLKDNATINFLKIRYSTGITGSQNFSAYQAYSTYQYIIDRSYNDLMGATMMALGNENLQWQQKFNNNLGVEIKLLDNRLSFTGDVYIEKTKDLVSSVDIPLANGFSSYVENIGTMQNKGFEAKASAFLIRKNNFRWIVSSGIQHNENEIIEISKALVDAQSDLESEQGTNPRLVYKEGYSTRTIWAVKSLGIDPSTGKEVYLDRFGNQTLEWNALDQVACGIAEPKYRGNISSNITYKGLSLNMNFGYFFGGQLYNSTLINKVENVDLRSNVDARVYNDRWMEPGDVAKYKSITDNSTTYKSSRFVQNENTFTGQNFTLTYQMRENEIKKALKISGIEYVSLSFSASDLFYLSTVKRERGTSYPYSRHFAFSLRTTF
ncbi:MAG: SusC/RagA family TonB-linked outer membrane protein [Draconibacterium sp.]